MWEVVRELAGGLVAAGVIAVDRVVLHSGTRIEFVKRSVVASKYARVIEEIYGS
jgi:hypothetical protein